MRSHPRSITLGLLCVAVTASLVALPAHPAAAGPQYPASGHSSGPIVAVGDSFISGLGAGDYRVSAGGCRRSQRSVARLVAIRAHRLLIDLSCPDARLAHDSDGPLNLDRQIAGVPADAAVVLMGAGGNDLGFATVTAPCLIAGTGTCQAAVAAARERLPAVTRHLTRALLHLRQRAPRAQVIALGYPAIVRSTPLCDLWLGSQRVTWLTALQRDLDRAIRTAAVRAAARYVDWPPEGGRHTLCDVEPWFVIGEATIIDEVLHPTYAAVRAMAQRLHPHVPRSPAAAARSAAR
jgi:hypothetical protein